MNTECEKSKRRVLFLDIDGVLQPAGNQYRFDHDMDALKNKLADLYGEPGYLDLDKYDVAAVYYDWDKASVNELKQLLDETGAEIVLSSDWRFSKNLDQMKLLFKIHGLDGYLKELVPRTEELSDKPDDISAYLSNHPDLFYYCVIDDCFMGRSFPGRFVYVNDHCCLTAKRRSEAACILENGPWWFSIEKEIYLADRWEYKKPEEKILPVIHDGIKKVVFLDFDGVVNDDLGTAGDGIAVHDDAIECIQSIIFQTGADIVFTSSRRLGYKWYLEGTMNKDREAFSDFELFSGLLARNGLMIKGMTPIIGSGPYARPAEIRSWLALRPDVESFVILDDDDFWIWDELTDHFVRTTDSAGCCDENGNLVKNPKRGLNKNHVYAAVYILKNVLRREMKSPFFLNP